METYNGQVRTPQDAIILFEACRLGLLPRVQRRLSEKERQSVRSGSVFVWDEREAGMRRWTDGKSWSASRVSGSFLTYREMEGKRGGNNFSQQSSKTPENGRSSADDQQDGEEGPDGYRYKPDGLMKQSFSITTSQGQHLHLISYFARSHATAPGLQQPSTDPTLRSIQPAKGMYPESSVNDQSNVPAVTRSPMVGAPNYMTPHSPAYHQASQPPPGYIPAVYAQHPYQYAPNPMHAPPYHYPMHHYPHGPNGLPPPPYPPGLYGPPPPQMSQPPPSAYDQRPMRVPENLPPPPPQSHSTPLPMSQPPQQSSIHAYAQHPTAAPAPAPSHYEQQQKQPQQQLPQPLPQPSARRESPRQQAAAALQIDPRLMIGSGHPAGPMGHLAAPPTKGAISDNNENKENATIISASQAPTITALVNGSIKEKTEDDVTTSPGGTKRSSAIQDIPSEKLGFREDNRALRQLDKVFAA